MRYQRSNKVFFLLSIAVVLLVLTLQIDAGGSKESKACEKCRKGKEPAKVKKFPANLTSCTSHGPNDYSREFYDESADNPNCAAPPVPNTNNNSVCYDDPVNERCSKKDSKKGPGKKHSSVTSGSKNGDIQGLGVVFLVLIVLAVGLYFVSNASSRKNFGQTMTNLNLNYTLTDTGDIGGAKPIAQVEE